MTAPRRLVRTGVQDVGSAAEVELGTAAHESLLLPPLGVHSSRAPLEIAPCVLDVVQESIGCEAEGGE
jgi:hypothetical protein